MSFDYVKTKNESITFRVDATTLNALRNESKKQHDTLNSLVNQIMKQHVDWHIHATKIGFIYMPRKILAHLVGMLSEKELIEFAKKYAREDVKSALLLLRDEYTVKAYLDVLESWIKISELPYNHKDVDKTCSFVIQHQLGKKFSFLLAEMIKATFEEFNLKEMHFDINDNTLAFKVNTEINN